jgi:hypothetical protein
MKIRNGFVSNSSSTSFTITNTSDEDKTIVDFVKENLHLVDDFNEMYDWYSYTHEEAIESAENYYSDITFSGKEEKNVTFGDEQGPILGRIFDYILRDGGTSDSFTWKFHEYYR